MRINYSNNEVVTSPTILINGKTTTDNGTVTITSPAGLISYSVNNYKFTALVNLVNGKNELSITSSGDSLSLNLSLIKLRRKPIHLSLILGSDSVGKFDLPAYKRDLLTGGTSLAVKKLQTVGRMFQAYTHEEMRSSSFGNRTFDFVEQGNRIKIHILQSNKTIAELRDINLAQQYKSATNSGGLYSHAMDLIKESNFYYPGIQVAAIYLDSTYDKEKDLILAHAALGGGSDDIRLAIFGSHGLHAWPNNFNEITSAFLDNTQLNGEVANDNNQTNTSAETFNVTAGAFLHEIGHLLGCPHQNSGIMLRDYIYWYNSFLVPDNNIICHWYNLDKIRFLYHDSFSLPNDNFDKLYSTTLSQSKGNQPALFPSKDGISITSEAGIYLIEVCVGELAKYHLEYLPKDNKPGVAYSVNLDYKSITDILKANGFNDKLNIRILSIGGDKFIDDFEDYVNKSESLIVESAFDLGKGIVTGYKSELLGRAVNEYQIIEVNFQKLLYVKVYYGMAVDGLEFFYDGVADGILLGKKSPTNTDFYFGQGETIKKFHVQSGWWIDAILLETTTGRKSAWFGGNGGGVSILQGPRETSQIVGMYAHFDKWLDGIGIVYYDSE